MEESTVRDLQSLGYLLLHGHKDATLVYSPALHGRLRKWANKHFPLSCFSCKSVFYPSSKDFAAEVGMGTSQWNAQGWLCRRCCSAQQNGRAAAATVAASQETHIAKDGKAYTKKDFQKWYGDAGGNIWDTAPTKPRQASPASRRLYTTPWAARRLSWIGRRERTKREKAKVNDHGSFEADTTSAMPDGGLLTSRHDRTM